MRKVPARNQRVSSRKQRRQQNLLEVTVRSRIATKQRNRWIVTWSCILVLVASAGGGIYYGVREGLRRFLWENPDYELSEIEIATDGSLAREQIIETAAIHERTNIFLINISKAREQLMQLPQVEVAEIRRVLPNKISITLTERKPIAWIAAKHDQDPTLNGNSFLVDAKGVLIQSKNRLSEYFHLPVIFGVRTETLEAGQTVEAPEIKAALDLVRLNSDNSMQARFQVRGIDVSKGYCMVVTDQTHAQITFGLDRIDWQLERLLMVLNRIEQSKRELQTVNLMVQRNMPVTYMPPPAPVTDEEETKPSDVKPATPVVKKVESTAGKSSSASKTKLPVQIRKAEPVRSRPATSKPVRRATPIYSGTKSNG